MCYKKVFEGLIAGLFMKLCIIKAKYVLIEPVNERDCGSFILNCLNIHWRCVVTFPVIVKELMYL